MGIKRGMSLIRSDCNRTTDFQVRIHGCIAHIRHLQKTSLSLHLNILGLSSAIYKNHKYNSIWQGAARSRFSRTRRHRTARNEFESCSHLLSPQRPDGCHPHRTEGPARIIAIKTGPTRARWKSAAKHKAFDLIRDRVLIKTQPEHLLAVLRSDTVSTNENARPG